MRLFSKENSPSRMLPTLDTAELELHREYDDALRRIAERRKNEVDEVLREYDRLLDMRIGRYRHAESREQSSE